MIAFLTSRLGIAGIAGIALIALWFAWDINVSRIRAGHADALRESTAETARVQSEWDRYKLQVAQATANQERIRADDNAKALNEREALVNEVARLRTLTTTATRQRNAASQELQRVLNNASLQDTAKLGAAAQLYLMRVRQYQRTAAPANNSTPAR